MSRIRADQLVNRAGSGGPKFPNGVAEGFSVSGIVTATGFVGPLTGNVTGNADTATTATTATNAQGLTGTPNITVGTVTGTDATFSGNLTVNGTTTTIDTAVTAVDSLNVEGNVGIGTDNPSVKLHVHEGNVRTTNTAKTNFVELGTDGNIEIKRTGGGGFIDFADDINQDYDVRIQEVSNGLKFITGGSGSASERLQITSTGKCEVYKGTSATGKTSGSEAFTVGNGAGNKRFSVYPDGTAVIGGQGTIANNNILLQNDGEAVFGGTISDSIGPLRRLDIVSSSVDLTLSAASHAGRLIRMTSTNRTFTIPSGSFSSGDMITIFHVGTGNMTIAQGSSVTLYNAADGATGNRTLAAKGMVTIACTDGASNEFVISGSQLT